MALLAPQEQSVVVALLAPHDQLEVLQVLQERLAVSLVRLAPQEWPASGGGALGHRDMGQLSHGKQTSHALQVGGTRLHIGRSGFSRQMANGRHGSQSQHFCGIFEQSAAGIGGDRIGSGGDRTGMVPHS